MCQGASPGAISMSAPAGKDGAASRPLGPDGKPIPGPAEVRQIQAARKMAQQQAQVNLLITGSHDTKLLIQENNIYDRQCIT